MGLYSRLKCCVQGSVLNLICRYFSAQVPRDPQTRPVLNNYGIFRHHLKQSCGLIPFNFAKNIFMEEKKSMNEYSQEFIRTRIFYGRWSLLLRNGKKARNQKTNPMTTTSTLNFKQSYSDKEKWAIIVLTNFLQLSQKPFLHNNNIESID